MVATLAESQPTPPTDREFPSTPTRLRFFASPGLRVAEGWLKDS